MSSFEEADRVAHPVDKEWCYDVLTARGFTAENREDVGFVRKYVFWHPDGRGIRWRVGVNANYFEFWNPCEGHWVPGGYWNDLIEHLDRGR